MMGQMVQVGRKLVGDDRDCFSYSGPWLIIIIIGYPTSDGSCSYCELYQILSKGKCLC